MVPRRRTGAVLGLVTLLCLSSSVAEDVEWKLNEGQLQKEMQDDVELPKMPVLLELLYKLSQTNNDLVHQEAEVVAREKKSKRMLWEGMRGCSFFFWKTWASC